MKGKTWGITYYNKNTTYDVSANHKNILKKALEFVIKSVECGGKLFFSLINAALLAVFAFSYVPWCNLRNIFENGTNKRALLQEHTSV